MASSSSKAERLQLRVSASEKATLDRAARAAKLSASEFVRSAALHHAEHVLADRHGFVLDEAQWERFEQALDRPPMEKPNLARLLNDRSVLDED
jgi:uncharacterized protein (DUF1778 family)